MTAAGAVTAAAAPASPVPAGPAGPPRPLSSLPLGLNTAPWDYVYAADVPAGGGLDTIQPLLKAAGIGLLRYGGGSYADYYDWQTNTDIQTCIWGNPFGSFTGAPFPYDTTAPFTGASCDNTDSLAFDQFASQARAIGAEPGDRELRLGHATSYAVNARPFLAAMKQADPAAQIGVPWAFGSDVVGATVPDNAQWNNTVLGQDGRYVSFVDAHYYPFSFSGATGGSNP
jgi:hypothetical protein